MNPAVLIDIPQALPQKVYTTERVGISKVTHDEHLKLWQGYARKTNEIRTLLAEHDVDATKVSQIFSDFRSIKVDYSFAFEGYINHQIFFDTIGGSGGPATGPIAGLIEKCYGSQKRWEDDLFATGMSGRAWVFVAYDHAEGIIFNYLGDAQNSYPIWNHTLLLALDVYEHAYYNDFHSARAKYIEAFMQVIDWDAINTRTEKALQGRF